MQNGRLISQVDEQKAYQLISLLELHKEIHDFLLPVDYIALQIPEYPSIITNPMDIGTVKKNLKDNHYTELREVLEHIQLIWDNCKTFNDPLTVSFRQEIYQMAEYLEKQTKRYCRKLKIIQSGEPEDTNLVTFDEKWDFTERVKKVEHSVMEKLAEFILDICPEAIEDEENDRVTIKIDSLDRSTFEKVQQFLDDNNTNESPYKKLKKSY